MNWSSVLSRSGTGRRTSYLAGLATVVVVGLVLGAMGSSAVALEEPAEPTSSQEPDQEPTQDPTEAPPATTSKAEAVPTVAAYDDAVSQRSYSVQYWNVLANDKCGNVTPCKSSRLTGPVAITSVPAGWRATATSSGLIRVIVPANIVGGVRTIGYAITDASGTATASLRVRVYLSKTPARYSPREGSKFSHAFQRGSSFTIRNHVVRTINSTPAGSQIRILSWSFKSDKIRNALIAAKKRGVSVQILMSRPRVPSDSDYGKLKKAFGGKRYQKNAVRGSWVYACKASCRGRGGTMHAKVFMFSQARNSRWIIMSGSGNLTDFAGRMQWNQLHTTVGNKEAYDDLQQVFAQAKGDKPTRPRQLELVYPDTTYWFTPLLSPTTKRDFTYQALNTVKCSGATNRRGSTIIRIAMYVWRDDRGDWMARKVRQLWNQGCDVRIIYAIMGNRNKAILYSPSGRGRIPMRQTLQVDDAHRPVWYLHQKYVAIAGNIAGKTNGYEVHQGSFNFSDLGMRSDENVQKIYGYPNFAAYNRDFNQIWKQRETRAPNPNSYVLQIERIGTKTGRYKFMD